MLRVTGYTSEDTSPKLIRPRPVVQRSFCPPSMPGALPWLRLDVPHKDLDFRFGRDLFAVLSLLSQKESARLCTAASFRPVELALRMAILEAAPDDRRADARKPGSWQYSTRVGTHQGFRARARARARCRCAVDIMEVRMQKSDVNSTARGGAGTERRTHVAPSGRPGGATTPRTLHIHVTIHNRACGVVLESHQSPPRCAAGYFVGIADSLLRIHR